MHEVSLGGMLIDYLSGEARERTTYEDLRQALLAWVVEQKGFPKSWLAAHVPYAYNTDMPQDSPNPSLQEGKGSGARTADLTIVKPGAAEAGPFGQKGNTNLLLLLFCPGQVYTYQREALALARLASFPLVAVTDTRDLVLFATATAQEIGTGPSAFPGPEAMVSLASAHPLPLLSPLEKTMESRILHAYTGLQKTCCTENCVFQG